MVSSLQHVFAAHEELGRQAIVRGLRAVRKKLHNQAAVVFGEVIAPLAEGSRKILFSRITRKTEDPGLVVGVKRCVMHLNRYGNLKPVAYWLEHGTKERVTQGRSYKPYSDPPTRVRNYGYREKIHSTGRIDPPAASMEKAATRIDESIIDDAVINEIQKACDKIIKKHGL